MYFGLVAVTGNHAPGCHGRELRHRDWQRSGRRIGSGLGLTRTRPSMDGHRPGPGPAAQNGQQKKLESRLLVPAVGAAAAPGCSREDRPRITFLWPGPGNRDLNIKLNTSLGPAGPGLRVSRIHHWHGRDWHHDRDCGRLTGRPGRWDAGSRRRLSL